MLSYVSLPGAEVTLFVFLKNSQNLLKNCNLLLNLHIEESMKKFSNINKFNVFSKKSLSNFIPITIFLCFKVNIGENLYILEAFRSCQKMPD